MKRKVKRLLAMFLTFIMVFSMGTVFVSAAEEGTGKSTETAGKPELSKKTADSVVLKQKTGMYTASRKRKQMEMGRR